MHHAQRAAISGLPARLCTLAAVLIAVTSQNAPASGDDTQLWTCGENFDSQTFTIETGPFPYNHIFLTNSSLGGGLYLVIDIAAWSNNTNSEVHVWANSTGDDGINQQWTYDPVGGTIKSLMNGYCLGAISSVAGAPVRTQTCQTGNTLQQFNYDATSGSLASRSNTSLCLDAGSVANCTLPPYNTYPYCNPQLSVDVRVADLVSRMLPIDFELLLDNSNPGIPHLGVPPIDFAECLHGTLSGCGAPYTDEATGYTSTGCPTSFPHALLTSASFNRTLWTLMGEAVSTEDRALHNQGVSGSIFWAPDINLFRDPRWGRGQEVPGEDPTLTGEYVYHYSRSLQEGEDPRYLKVVSTAKHFSAYDMESSDGTNRNEFNAIVSEHDLVEYYWPAFRSAVQRARVHSIMCSYNAVNGVPSCANGFFNNEIARNQWGWDGFMVSDCGAIDNIQNAHHYTSDENATIKVAIEGGTDVNCGSFYNTYIYAAYVNGSITLADLQQAASRFLTTVFWLGLMDPSENVVYTTYNNTFVDTPAHRQLAFEAARQSIILLQNDPTNTPWGANQPLLPLQGNKIKKIALIGPNANATQTLLSNYHGTNTLVNNQSILQGLQRRGVTDGFTVDFSVGCPYISCADTSGFAAATTAAQAADLAIVVVGLCSDNCPGGSADEPVHEGEGHDRINTTLPGFQEQLVLDIAATGTPTVVVLVHGGALAIDQTKAKVATILDALYPGEMGGDAVTSVLFGDVSPAGRTTTTWYPAAYQSQRPLVTDMELAPHGNVAGVTYLYYNGTTLWPFGWGLSYTTFAFNWLSDDASAASVDAEAFATGVAAPVYAVNVTNTGNVVSDVSALAFFSTNVAGEPLTELFDFQRTADLAPGQSVVMYFTLPPSVAAVVTQVGDQVVMPGKFVVRIGDVAAGNFVEGTLQITGKAQTMFSYAKAEQRYAQSMNA